MGRWASKKPFKKDNEVKTVILTALVVGGSTVLGAILGVVFKTVGQRYNEIVMSLTAGIMLSAAVIGLILPSLEYVSGARVIIIIVGVFAGAFLVNLFDLLLPLAYTSKSEDGSRGVFLFVAAIAIHNLPEGIAAGVGFGTDDPASGFFIATAIALQNVPEGMAVALALIGTGVSPIFSFFVAATTAIIEVGGTLIGFFATGVSSVMLPFILSLAGGSMLYVINEEIIPHNNRYIGSRISAYLILLGFCFMLVLSELL